MSEQEAEYGDYPPTEVQRTWTSDDGTEWYAVYCKDCEDYIKGLGRGSTYALTRDEAMALCKAHLQELHPAPAQPTLPSPEAKPVTSRLREMLPRLLDERERKGIATYGRSLETWNGRDAHRDLQEELVDALQYAMQAAMERADLERWLREALEILARFRAELRNLPGGIDIALSDRYIALQEKAAKALPPDAKN